MATQVTTIDLLRHGMCEGGEIFRGSTDVMLTSEGWRQMSAAVECPVAPWQAIVTSPLQRCACFAEQLAEFHELTAVTYAALAEIDFGDWEGRLISDVQAEQGEALQKYLEKPTLNTPSRGEPIVDFSARLWRGWNEVVTEYHGQHLLMVTHGGAIRVLLTRLLSMPLDAIVRIEVPYACLTRIKIYHSDGCKDWSQMVAHNTSIQAL